MVNEKDEELDDFFRKGIKEPVKHTGFEEADWDAMERMLDKPKKRPVIIYWLPVLGSAAALVLIFLGWLFLKPEVIKPQHQNQQVTKVSTNKPGKENTGTSGGTTRQPTDSTNNTPLAYYAKNLGVTRHGHKNKSFFIDTLSADGGRRNVTGLNAVINDKGGQKTQPALATTKASENADPLITNNDGNNSKQVLATVKTDNGNNAVTSTDDHATPAKNLQPDSASKIAEVDNKPGLKRTKIKLGTPNSGVVYALGVLASSDLNGVNSLSQTKLGGNFGLAFSVTIKKWTISTGAAYSIKPYLTPGSNYHTAYVFKNEPVSVSANCRMIDIPLNVNYQVYGNHRNKITVGTGLSSYIILREDYKFNYESQYAQGPAAYSVINKNHNLFGVLNLDATYQHQVNSKMGITLQPYFKLPLSNIGASQVKLQTAGVAVGVTWNLNPFKNP